MAQNPGASSASDDLDALGLLALGSGAETRFGDIDVSPAVHGLTARSGLNNLPSAELRLARRAPAGLLRTGRDRASGTWAKESAVHG